ncbi:MAG: HAMP domain-containing histidine kinase [Candidatus Obscuribacterales bacterium]|nr:HAMP domain-containing histidine kinase [Candidatus Obscuribacterales bacterium]
MKVAQKGLIIVGVPLLFQLGFAVVLLLLFAQLKDDLVQEDRAREAVATAAAVMNSMMDATTAAFVCAATGDSRSIAVFDREMNRIKTRTERMRVLSANQSDQIARIDAIVRDSQDLENAFRKYLKEPDLIRQALQGTDDKSEGSASQLSKIASSDLGVSFGAYISNAELLADKKLKSLDASGRMLFSALLAGLVADVVLTVAISIFISRGIIWRLNTVCKNVESLRRGKVLETPLTGDDEIAAVDAALHRTAAALKEGERSKSEALSVIQQQLQAPLSDTHSILLEIQAQGDALSRKTLDRLGLVLQNLDRLLKLIQDLVQSGSEGKFSLVLQSISLHELIEKSAQICESMATKHYVKVTLEPCEDALFTGDFDLLSQVLVNLITNAIKFSPAESTVTVKAIKDENSIEIRVADRGCGIADGDQTKVFQLFQQVRATDATVKGGTGLGLAICKSIVAEHGGSMGVDSRLGEGSCFWFRLPRIPAIKGVAVEPEKIPIRLSITSKVAALVLGPLVVTTMMFAYLTGALRVLDQHITAQVNAKQITAMVNKLVINTVNILRATANTKLVGAAEQVSWAQERQAQFARLRFLTKNRPDLLPLVDQLETELHKINATTSEALNPSVAENVLLQPTLLNTAPAEKFRSSATITRQLGRKIVILSSETDRRNQQAILDSYKWIVLLTLLALLIGALLTILSSVYFSRHITRRLSRLRANAERLGREPLQLAADVGADEVARLEKFFFDASQTLEELNQFRKHVVGVVSHEMKTPLQSVFGIIVLLPRLAEGSPRQTQVAEGAAVGEYHVRRVIRLVHDLLTVEKIHSGTFFLNLQESSLADVCENALLLVVHPRDKNQSVSLGACDDVRLNLDAERIASVLATIMNNISALGGTTKLSASISGENAVQFLLQVEHLDTASFNEKLFEQFSDLTSEKFSGITGSIVSAHGGTLIMDADAGTILLSLPCRTKPV